MCHSVKCCLLFALINTVWTCSPLGEWLDPQQWFGETEARDIFDPTPDQTLLIGGSGNSFSSSSSGLFGSGSRSNSANVNSYSNPNSANTNSYSNPSSVSNFDSPGYGSPPSSIFQPQGTSLRSPSSFGSGTNYPSNPNYGAPNTNNNFASSPSFGRQPESALGFPVPGNGPATYYSGRGADLPPQEVQTEPSGSGPVLGILPALGNLGDLIPGLDLFGRRRKRNTKETAGCRLISDPKGPFVSGKWKLSKGSQFGFKQWNPYGLFDQGVELNVHSSAICASKSPTFVSVTGNPAMRNCEQFTQLKDVTLNLICTENGWKRLKVTTGSIQYSHKLLITCRPPKKTYCKR